MSVGVVHLVVTSTGLRSTGGSLSRRDPGSAPLPLIVARGPGRLWGQDPVRCHCLEHRANHAHEGGPVFPDRLACRPIPSRPRGRIHRSSDTIQGAWAIVRGLPSDRHDADHLLRSSSISSAIGTSFRTVRSTRGRPDLLGERARLRGLHTHVWKGIRRDLESPWGAPEHRLISVISILWIGGSGS
jgi:hypothetical protein